jgi:hypothetical protein
MVRLPDERVRSNRTRVRNVVFGDVCSNGIQHAQHPAMNAVPKAISSTPFESLFKACVQRGVIYQGIMLHAP